MQQRRAEILARAKLDFALIKEEKKKGPGGRREWLKPKLAENIEDLYEIFEKLGKHGDRVGIERSRAQMPRAQDRARVRPEGDSDPGRVAHPNRDSSLRQPLAAAPPGHPQGQGPSDQREDGHNLPGDLAASLQLAGPVRSCHSPVLGHGPGHHGQPP
jgi:hypothetical protein